MMGLGKDAHCRLNYICELDDIPDRPFHYKVQTGDGEWVLDESKPYRKSLGLWNPLTASAAYVLQSMSSDDTTCSCCTLLTHPDCDQDGNVNNVGYPEPAAGEVESNRSAEQNTLSLYSNNSDGVNDQEISPSGKTNILTG